MIFGVTNDNEVRALLDAEKDAEIISEQIKTRLDPVSEFHLSFYRTEEDGYLFARRDAGWYFDTGTGYRCNSFDKEKSCFSGCVSTIRIYGT